MTHTQRITRVGGLSLVAGFFLLGTVACEGLLDVSDPDIVVPESVTGPKGAELYWAGAIGEFAQSFSTIGNEYGQVLYSGMLTDEFHLSGTFPTRDQVDRREIDPRNGTMNALYLDLQQARVSAENAATLLEEELPGDPRIAEMYSLAGYTYLAFGENYCSGVPYSKAPLEGDLEFGQPTPTTETFQLALDRFTSAAAATGGDTDQQYLAAIGEGRAELNRGNFAAAASAVASVPTSWEYLVRSKEGGDFGQRNAIYEMNSSQRRWSLSDGEGGNGVLWRTNTDVRVPWVDEGEVGFDEGTPLYEQRKYASWEDDTPLASGVEARLIEAEAALNMGSPADDTWLDILNTLRADIGLAALTDPGSADARVDLFFEERARWLFATGHRLGDLRRLVRQYSRSAAAVFPVGAFHKGGEYGPDVNFPIPEQERENPNMPEEGDMCIDRSA